MKMTADSEKRTEHWQLLWHDDRRPPQAMKMSAGALADVEGKPV